MTSKGQGKRRSMSGGVMAGRMMSRRAVGALMACSFLLGGLGVAFVLVGPAQAQAPARGGELVRALQAGPDSLDPAQFVASETGRILANIYEGLLAPDAAGRLQPRLAERWEVSPDGQTYTFSLRSGVTFHDGSPFSAADVKYTYERLMDPSTGYSGTDNWEAVTAIEVVDPLTIQIRLSEPYAPFLAYLASPSAAIVPEGAGEALHSHPVGTGPFQFVEWVRERQVTLERYEGYWDPELPYLDRVIFRVLPDATTRLNALVSGDVDVVDMNPAQEARVAASPRTKVVTGSLNTVQLLALNINRSPWNDRKVRQAVAHAIDRQWLVDAVAWGHATPLYSALTPVNGYYTPIENPYPYDPDRARELLAEAGYPDGFSATVTVPSIYEFHVDTAEALRAQLRQVGIELEIELIDWARWLEEVYAGAQYDTTVIGFTGKLDPHHELGRYMSNYERNFMNFADPTYDRLIRKAVQTTDVGERMELYAEAQRILAHQLAAIFTMDPHIMLGVAADVQGWQIFPNYIDDLREVYRDPS